MYLEPATLRALRIRSIEEGISATRYVEQLIVQALKGKRRGVKA